VAQPAQCVWLAIDHVVYELAIVPKFLQARHPRHHILAIRICDSILCTAGVFDDILWNRQSLSQQKQGDARTTQLIVEERTQKTGLIK